MNSKKLYLIAAIILAAGLCVCGVSFALADFDYRNLSSDGPFRDGAYTASGPVLAVAVNDLDAQLRVLPSQDGTVRVTYRESDKIGYEIREDTDGNLTVSKQNRKHWYEYIFNLEFEPYIVTVYVPQDFGGDMTLATGNGEVSVKDVSLGDLEIDTSNQGVELKNLTVAGNVEAATKNGKVELDQVSVGESLLCKTSNGRMDLNSVEARDIRVQSSNGRIFLDTVSADEGIEASTFNQGVELNRVLFGTSLRCETKNGSIKGSVVGNQNDFHIQSRTKNGRNNLPEEFGAGAKQLSVFTLNGDIEIDFVG